MYVKKYSQIIGCRNLKPQQNLSVKIIDIIYRLGNKEIPIIYLIKKLNCNSIDVYNCVQDLLIKNILDRVYTSVCPLCGTENLSSTEDNNKIVCSFCKEQYFSYNKDEKFKLKL